MKKRNPTAWKTTSAGSVKLEGRLQQRTGTHCELSGLWENVAGTRMRILEGQLLPAYSGHACHWTYVGFMDPANS
ncbi:hypothetical protein [Arthrobacter sp. ISL-30]|uniref:hypothetical protein n=1 Tax=Arthrobacter sp. ISL-30 TaxID=2819109 RepID=UPI001BE940FC|nr:hypothetical protein [Arthrobacter sp. ISL-30]MBT2512263.1 hypothetical protein [Arthrobacter sp. ISL-30]